MTAQQRKTGDLKIVFKDVKYATYDIYAGLKSL